MTSLSGDEIYVKQVLNWQWYNVL